jgi:hypothetical protein
MKHIKLFENFPEAHLKKDVAQERLRDVGDINEQYMTMDVLYKWFGGDFMGRGDDATELVAIKLLKKLGEVYHDKVSGPAFRVAVIEVEKPTISHIRGIKSAATGMKMLQSWSTSIDGATWFHDYFMKRDSSDRPMDHKALVMVKTDANNLNQLVTFDECIQFMHDARTSDVEELSAFGDKMTDWLEVDIMLKLHELICVAPKEVAIEVNKVYVKPISHARAKVSMNEVERSGLEDGVGIIYDADKKIMYIGSQDPNVNFTIDDIDSESEIVQMKNIMKDLPSDKWEAALKGAGYEISPGEKYFHRND